MGTGALTTNSPRLPQNLEMGLRCNWSLYRKPPGSHLTRWERLKAEITSQILPSTWLGSQAPLWKAQCLPTSSWVRPAFDLVRTPPPSLGVRRVCYQHICVAATFSCGTCCPCPVLAPQLGAGRRHGLRLRLRLLGLCFLGRSVRWKRPHLPGLQFPHVLGGNSWTPKNWDSLSALCTMSSVNFISLVFFPVSILLSLLGICACEILAEYSSQFHN